MIMQIKIYLLIFLKRKNGFLGLISSRLDRTIASSTFKLLISAIFLRIYMSAKRIAYYYIHKLIRGKDAVELLIDFSIATKGYKREIHRDSDLRKYVFILFLNAIDDSGGNFEIYRLKNKTKRYKPQPNRSECELVETFIPKPGMLMVFKNSVNAYHAVSEMTGEQKRYFIYGGYTQLSGNIPETKKMSTKKLPTEFHLYN